MGTKWAFVVFNQPKLDLAPKPLAVVVSSQEQAEAAPASLTEGKAVLRNLVRDAPPEFCCFFTGQLMMDPVQSEYGHVFERAAVTKEIQRSGGICPALEPEDASTDARASAKYYGLDPSDEAS